MAEHDSMVFGVLDHEEAETLRQLLGKLRARHSKT